MLLINCLVSGCILLKTPTKRRKKHVKLQILHFLNNNLKVEVVVVVSRELG